MSPFLLSQMPEKQSQILQLAYDQGFKTWDIACQLECTENAIRLRLQAAREKLRQLLRGKMAMLLLPWCLLGRLRRCFAGEYHSQSLVRFGYPMAGMITLGLVMWGPPCLAPTVEFQEKAITSITASLAGCQTVRKVGEFTSSPIERVELTENNFTK